MSCRLGFLGCGNIVRSICEGLNNSGQYKPSEVCMSGASPRDFEWASKLGYVTTTNNTEILNQSDVIVLAVKPNIVSSVLKELYHDFRSRHLMMSVAAGVNLECIEKQTKDIRVARIMLNTTVATTKGASVYTLGSRCNADDGTKITNILSCLGYTSEMGESYFDVVSALVGSGPAFLYGVIEAMADGAVMCGLGRKEAMELAAYTLAGTGLNAINASGIHHPAELRDFVCSPGGSSIQGVYALEKAGYKKAFMTAIIKAYEQNKILGEMAEEKKDQ